MDHTSPKAISAFLATLAVAFTLASCGRDQTGSVLTGTGASVPGDGILSMTGDKTLAQPGEAVGYAVTVRNTTPLQLRNVEVDVTVPGQKLVVTDAPGGAINNDRIRWDIPSLAAGQVLTFTYRVTLNSTLSRDELVRTVVSLRAENLQVPATDQFEVRIGAAAPGTGTGASSAASIPSSSVNSGYSFFLGNQASTGSSVVPGAIVLLQQADQAERQPGTRVAYTVTVRNASPAGLSNLTVQALLPPALFITNVGGGRVSGNTLTWTIPTLAPGAARTFTYRASVRSTAQAGDVVTTIAQVSSPSLAAPQVATADVRIIARLPQTGADDRFTAPLEDTAQYLRAVR